MPIIILKTLINADLQTCFDATRNIDAHAKSMAGSKETAVAGRTSGQLCVAARHFGTVADWLFVEKYMRRLLITRNNWIKTYAEDEYISG